MEPNPPLPLSINIDPFALRVDLNRRLTLVYQRVAVGMNRCAGAEVDDAHIPGVLAQFRWSGEDGPTSNWIREDMRTWLLMCGFRDVIEGVTLFLDSLHQFFLCLEIGQHNLLSGSELEMCRKRHSKFHRGGLPDKLKALKTAGYVALPDHMRASVESLNAARNCLVHRGGRVDTLDTGGDDSLVVYWSRSRVVVQSPDGSEREVGSNVVQVETGENLALRLESTARQFKLGDKVSFTAAEFSEIVFTFATCFLQPVMGSVAEALRKAGFVSPDGTLVSSKTTSVRSGAI